MPTRSKRSQKGENGKWPARMCTNPTLGYNLAFFIRARVLRHTLTLNDLTKQVYMNALKQPARTSLHGCPWTTYLNKFTWTPSNDPPKWVYTDALKRPAQMSLHGCPQMTHPNEFKWMPSNNPPNEFTWAPKWPKQRHKGELGKWAARMCIKPTLGHNLAFLIRAHVHGCTLTMNDPTEWVYMNTLKQPAWNSLHGRRRTTHPKDPPEWAYTNALKWNAQMSLQKHLQATHSNEFTCVPTRLKWRRKGELGKWAVRTCKKSTLCHNLAFLIPPCVPGHVLTLNDSTKWISRNSLKQPTRKSLHRHPRTTLLNEFTWMASNDPPEWVYTDALKRHTRTSLHRCPQTSHLK